MGKLWRVVLVGISAGVVGIVWMVAVGNVRSAAPAKPAAPAAGVPEGQTYTGSGRCGHCHLKQFTTWKASGHGKAFEKMPAKYKADKDCLKCHTTGYGMPTGYKDESTASLAGAGCEACHGPGSKHEEICKKFTNKKELSKEEEALCKGSIYEVLPKNVCIRCHIEQKHKEHPPYDK